MYAGAHGPRTTRAQVAAGRMTVGDVVMVHGLIFQLTLPLGILGSVYNQVRVATTDMQKLVALLENKPAVVSVPGAPSLELHAGRIEFDDVTFAYTVAQRVEAGNERRGSVGVRAI